MLFLQGGSRLQFSMIPMNLLGAGRVGRLHPHRFVGQRRPRGSEEGRRDERRVGRQGDELRSPAEAGDLKLNPQAAYVHYTSNETIQGVQFQGEPEVGDVPLVVATRRATSSTGRSHVSKYGLIYACAQKNAGPAGVTVVIIRKDLLKNSDPNLPGYLNYQIHAENDSMWNTPPTFGIYVLKPCSEWLRDDDRRPRGDGPAEPRQGEAAVRRARRQRAASTQAMLRPQDRSLMNVTFRLPSEELERSVRAAKRNKRGLTDLKGHRSVGGIRASIYNAMPVRRRRSAPRLHGGVPEKNARSYREPRDLPRG